MTDDQKRQLFPWGLFLCAGIAVVGLALPYLGFPGYDLLWTCIGSVGTIVAFYFANQLAKLNRRR